MTRLEFGQRSQFVAEDHAAPWEGEEEFSKAKVLIHQQNSFGNTPKAAVRRSETSPKPVPALT